MTEIAQGSGRYFDYTEVEAFLGIQDIQKLQKTVILVSLASMCQYAKVF
jgi:hypothetical protein